MGAYLGFGLSPVRLPAPRKKNGGAPAASAATSGSESEGDEVTDVMHVDHGNPVKRQASWHPAICAVWKGAWCCPAPLLAPVSQNCCALLRSWDCTCRQYVAHMLAGQVGHKCVSAGDLQVGRLRQLCHHAGAHGGGHGCVQNRRAAAHQGPGAAGLLGLA